MLYVYHSIRAENHYILWSSSAQARVNRGGLRAEPLAGLRSAPAFGAPPHTPPLTAHRRGLQERGETGSGPTDVEEAQALGADGHRGFHGRHCCAEWNNASA
jgi:hypothetical protein